MVEIILYISQIINVFVQNIIYIVTCTYESYSFIIQFCYECGNEVCIYKYIIKVDVTIKKD